MQTPRPLTVTIIGWALLAFSGIGCAAAVYLFLTTDLNQGGVLGLLIVFAAIGLLNIAIAVGILNGANWARILFLWITPADIVIAAAGSGITPGLLFKAAYFVTFAFFLTRQDASVFFGASRKWRGVTYAFATCWVALTTVITFLPQIVHWAETSYRIGYVSHDTASLKLPSDWTEMPAEQPLPEYWRRHGLETIAWGGLAPLPAPHIDAQTGKTVQRDDKEAFQFQAAYVRDTGGLMPCGLVRYRLAFPNHTPDPLRQVMRSQLILYADAFKHQYIWEGGWRILEIDVSVADARYIVWNWWRAEEPAQVVGMILGMEREDAARRDACGVSKILESLEIERPDGSIWAAGELNTQSNPAMTPVSGLLIQIEQERLRAFGIDQPEFFSWLENNLNDQRRKPAPEDASSLRYQQSDTVLITLADVASVSVFGRATDSPTHNELRLAVAELFTQCRLKERDRHSLRKIYNSVTSLTVSLKPQC